MLFIRSIENSRLVATRFEGAPDPATAPKGAWYDLIDPTPEERAFVDKATGVETPTREEIEEIEVSSRLYNEDGVEYMTVTAAAKLDTEEPVRSPVMFILGDGALVTVRYVELRPFTNVIDRSSRPGGCQSSDAENLMLTLIEAMVDRLADALEKSGDTIDQISRRVFRASSMNENVGKRDHDLQATIERVGQAGDMLGIIRESLVGFNRLVSYHHGMGHIAKGAIETDGRIRTIQRDVSALADHASYLGSKIAFLLDATLGLINLEQNQIIKIFSIAAVCLMPPTLVASVYGMNFKHIPELDFDFGYPMALALMLITAVLPVWYFKRKGWF
ncbi:MAG TPA: magnesium transporter CorA family protein [Rhodoblastus sp.]|nr:magnesium transporter CorA family protein [Rhodoblastus sp.]